MQKNTKKRLKDLWRKIYTLRFSMTWSFKLPLVSWRDCKEVDEDLEMELVEVEKVELEKVEELEEWSV